VIEKVVIGNATLYCGDCLEILPTLPKVDAVVTDPPYGININKSNRLSISRGHVGEKWDEIPADIDWILDMNCPAIIWGGNYFKLPPTRCFLIWDKNNPERDFADCEMAWTNLDGVARRIIQRPMNMDGGKVHPTQKPVRVIDWCLSFLRESKLILDSYMGSGTTGVSCANLGKSFIGIERERRYFDIACERIAAAQSQGRLFE